MVLFLAVSVVLSACGSDTEKTTSDKEEEKSTAAEQKEVNNKPTENEYGNLVFTKVGQKSDVDGGTIELLKIKDINETVEIAPLKVTIKDIKLFKMTNLDEQFKTDLTFYSETATSINDEFTYVQNNMM